MKIHPNNLIPKVGEKYIFIKTRGQFVATCVESVSIRIYRFERDDTGIGFWMFVSEWKDLVQTGKIKHEDTPKPS